MAAPSRRYAARSGARSAGVTRSAPTNAASEASAAASPASAASASTSPQLAAGGVAPDANQRSRCTLRTSSLPSSTTITGVRLRMPVREPQRGDFPNAAQFCQAQRAFLGEDAFADRYGTNKNKANAMGKCVSSNN